MIYSCLTRPNLRTRRAEPQRINNRVNCSPCRLPVAQPAVSGADTAMNLPDLRLPVPPNADIPDGRAVIAKRQCTADYKLMPIRQELRSRPFRAPGPRAPKNSG